MRIVKYAFPVSIFSENCPHTTAVLVWLLQVCTQVLELPEHVHIVTSAVAAGHLGSSSIYPACFAPYLVSTACSDGRVRFWRCDVSSDEQDSVKYHWLEWDMMIKTEDTSAIRLPGASRRCGC